MITELKNKKVILWDFDGVILDSMAVRDVGFKIVLNEFPENEVDLLMKFHRKNGGLSRYVKFRYFFEEIRKENITAEKLQDLARRFSEVMREKLIDKELLIKDSVNFIEGKHSLYKMHIVSGSDQEELRFLCQQLGLSSKFLSIHGSPTPKKELVRKLLQENRYAKEGTVLIGDSINDFEAAKENNIDFIGYNNEQLQKLKAGYLKSFKEI